MLGNQAAITKFRAPNVTMAAVLFMCAGTVCLFRDYKQSDYKTAVPGGLVVARANCQFLYRSVAACTSLKLCDCKTGKLYADFPVYIGFILFYSYP